MPLFGGFACSQPTYEELKPIKSYHNTPWQLCSQPTYEELKQTWNPRKIIMTQRSQPTYEELKQEIFVCT
mgnify:CR=1 FL=1